MGERLSVLIIPGHTIYPAQSGGAHNQLALLSILQHRYRVRLVITPDNVAKKDLRALEALLSETQLIPIGFEEKNLLQRFKERIQKQRRKWSGRDSAYQLWKNKFINNFLIRDHELVGQLEEVISQETYDIVQIDHTKNLALTGLLPAHVKLVYVHHELYFTRVQQDLEIINYPEPYVKYIVSLVKAVELYYLGKCQGIVTFNEDDQHLLQQAGLTLPIQVSKPYCLLDPVENVYEPSLRPKLIFIGGEAHYPNRDGLAWFLDQVYPRLSTEAQKTEIWVTGAWSQSFRETYKSKPLHFTGFVPELDPYLKNAILIAPIRIGSGVRIKICTAMAKGVPVVSTTLGASGISGLVHKENILIADTAQEFATATELLIGQINLRKKLSENVAFLAQTLFDGEEFARTRAAFLEQIASS